MSKPPLASRDSSTPNPPRRAPWALAGLALAVLSSSLGTSIANVALPTLVRTFGASLPRVQWVVLAYLLAITTLIVGVGRLGDLVGRRRLLLAGLSLFVAASALCGAAPTLGWLIGARAAQGLGAAVMTAFGLAFVAEIVPAEETGKAMGLLGTMSAVGTALGPTLGGLLLGALSWRAIFLCTIPAGLAALVLGMLFLPADRAASTGERFDFAGTAVLAPTLAALALAMTPGRQGFGSRGVALLCAAAAGAIAFALVERRAAAPLVRPEVVRDPTLRSGFATNALATTVVMATLVVGPFYLAGALGLDAARTGLVLSCGPVVAALAGMPAGRAVDRFGAQRTAAGGLAAMAAGTLALGLLPASLGVPGYLAPLALLTAGYAVFQAANNTAVMTAIGPGQRGVVSGMLNLSRHLGLLTGASLMGAIFARGTATADIAAASPAAVTSGMHWTFAAAAALVGVALAVLSASRPLRAAGRALEIPATR